MTTTLQSLRVRLLFPATALIFFFGTATIANAQQEVIDNNRVVALVAAGIGDSVLVPKIAISRVVMDASQSGLLRLKSSGVSDAVIVAMMERAAVNGYISQSGDLDRIELPAGTEVKIVTTDKISGRKVTEGQTVTFKVADDVVIASRTVIARGTDVVGVVSRAKKPGMAGRGGQLSVIIQSTKSVDGETIKLRAAKSGKGGDNFGTAYTLSYFMGIGLLIPGKNAEIKAGTTFTAYTDESKFVIGSDTAGTSPTCLKEAVSRYYQSSKLRSPLVVKVQRASLLGRLPVRRFHGTQEIQDPFTEWRTNATSNTVHPILNTPWYTDLDNS